MSISLQRFEQLIDAYGSDPSHWPAHERQAALGLLAESSHAARIMQEARWLDEELEQFDVPAFEGLNSRLLQVTLPERLVGPVERLMRWLVPPAPSSGWWRPAALACLPLMTGLVMGMELEMFADTTGDLYSVSSEEVELDFISLADYAYVEPWQ